MWPYTDGAGGPLPHTVAGVGMCGLDTFNGSAGELVQFWTGVAAVVRTT